MSTAMQALEPKAFHYEARAYCEKFDIPMEEYESVRLSMAVRELQTRMEPWVAMLVKAHPSRYSIRINEPLPPEYIHLQEQIDAIRRHEMDALGLVPAQLGCHLATEQG